MPSLLDLRKELRELRKANNPKAISLMKKDDILMELERNRMLNKFMEHNSKSVNETADVSDVETVEVSAPVEKKTTKSVKKSVKIVPKEVLETVEKQLPKKSTKTDLSKEEPTKKNQRKMKN